VLEVLQKVKQKFLNVLMKLVVIAVIFVAGSFGLGNIDSKCIAKSLNSRSNVSQGS
jgi:hypothetical protein